VSFVLTKNANANTGMEKMTNRYHEHQELIKRFKLLCTKELPGIRIFDRTVGMFYAKRINNNIINYVPVKINNPGMADAYGLYSSIRHGLIHLEFEFKTGKAKQTNDQKTWQNFIEMMNGGFFLIRDERQGLNDIKNFLVQRGYASEFGK